MHGKDFRFSRHLKLWEEQNKLIKRTVIAVLLFGILLLIKVLGPLTKITHNTGQVEKEIHQLTEKKGEIAELSSILADVEVTLKEVRGTILQQPWMREKEKLVDRFRELRRQPGRLRSQEENQNMADETIREVADQVRKKVIAPLEATLSQNPELRDNLQILSQKIETLNANMNQWEHDHIGKVWYRTLNEKSAEMYDLTRSLEKQFAGLPGILVAEQEKIKVKRNELNKNTIKLQQSIADRQKYLNDLNKQMQHILPGWLRGILGVEDMIQIFPPILLVLAIYIFSLAILLSRHYEFVAKNVNLSAVERNDLSTSSIWTLTDRGRLGTIITLMVYILFMLIMWLFFEWGFLLLNRWLITTDLTSWYIGIVSHQGFLWMGRCIFILITGAMAVRPAFIKKLIFHK